MPGQGTEKPGFGTAQVAASTADEKQPRTVAKTLEKEAMTPNIGEWHGKSAFLKYYYNPPLQTSNPVPVVTAICDPKAAENALFFLDRNQPSGILLPR
jgi:hypothetical protein